MFTCLRFSGNSLGNHSVCGHTLTHQPLGSMECLIARKHKLADRPIARPELNVARMFRFNIISIGRFVWLRRGIRRLTSTGEDNQGKKKTQTFPVSQGWQHVAVLLGHGGVSRALECKDWLVRPEGNEKDLPTTLLVFTRGKLAKFSTPPVAPVIFPTLDTWHKSTIPAFRLVSRLVKSLNVFDETKRH